MEIIERIRDWFSKEDNQKKIGLGILLSLGAVTCYKVGRHSKRDEYNVQLYLVPKPNTIDNLTNNIKKV